MLWTLGVGLVLAGLATLSVWDAEKSREAREAASALRWMAGLGLMGMALVAAAAGAIAGAVLAAAAALPMLIVATSRALAGARMRTDVRAAQRAGMDTSGARVSVLRRKPTLPPPAEEQQRAA